MTITEETTLKDIINDPEVESIDFAEAIAQLSEEQVNDFDTECGTVDSIVRYTQLLVFPSGGDAEISTEEENEVKTLIKNFLQKKEIPMDVEEIYESAIEFACVDDVFLDTLKIFGRYFSKGVLKSIAIDMYKVAAADGIKEDEEEFLKLIVCYWYGMMSDEELDEYFSTGDEDDE